MQRRFQVTVGPNASVTGAARMLIAGTVVVHNTLLPDGVHTT
jgi:hypothetical protein